MPAFNSLNRHICLGTNVSTAPKPPAWVQVEAQMRQQHAQASKKVEELAKQLACTRANSTADLQVSHVAHSDPDYTPPTDHITLPSQASCHDMNMLLYMLCTLPALVCQPQEYAEQPICFSYCVYVLLESMSCWSLLVPWS